MRGDAIRTHSNDSRVGLAEAGKRVTEIARFLGASRGVVLRVEIEHSVSAFERVAADDAPVVGGKGEARKLVALLYHARFLWFAGGHLVRRLRLRGCGSHD